MNNTTQFSPLTSGRTIIFIDGAYLQRILNDQFGGGKLDYAVLSSMLSGSSELLRTYYYDCCAHENASYRRFLNALTRIPAFKIRLGQIALGANGARFQKGVDVQLAVDLMRLSINNRRFTNAVIVAGDADFVPAITQAADLGVKTVLVHGRPDETVFVAKSLIKACDDHIEIGEELIEACRMPGSPVNWRRRSDATPAKAALVAPQPVLPEVTRLAPEGQLDRAVDGEVVDAHSGCTVTAHSGAVVIARPHSRVRALKGSTVYLFDDVSFSCNVGSLVIPVGPASL